MVLKYTSLAVLVMMLAGIAMAVLVGADETGPGCPTNPQWLGYCKDAPVRQ